MITLAPIPTYTGTIPIRQSQTPIVFTTNVGGHLDYLSTTFTPATNILVADLNQVATEITDAVTIINDGTSYRGDWVAGYNTVGYAVADTITYTDGEKYTSKVDTNLTEPTTATSNADWDYHTPQLVGNLSQIQATALSF